MRQNDIFKNFNLPRWATPIICGLLLGSAGDFAMKFLRATQRSSDPTTADPSRRDPIPQIQRGIPSHKFHHQSEVDRTGAVERRISWCPDVGGTGTATIIAVVDRQQQREGHLPVLIHTLWRLYAIYVYTVCIFYTSNRICIILQKTYIFGTWYKTYIRYYF